MVLEIALGIVLAVLILKFWPVLLGLGAILLAAAIVLIPAGLLVAWAFSDFASFGVIGAILGIAFLIAWFTRSKPHSEVRRALGYDGGVEAAADRDLSEEEKHRQQLGYGRRLDGPRRQD